jgi:hypothetical protein
VTALLPAQKDGVIPVLRYAIGLSITASYDYPSCGKVRVRLRRSQGLGWYDSGYTEVTVENSKSLGWERGSYLCEVYLESFDMMARTSGITSMIVQLKQGTIRKVGVSPLLHRIISFPQIPVIRTKFEEEPP